LGRWPRFCGDPTEAIAPTANKINIGEPKPSVYDLRMSKGGQKKRNRRASAARVKKLGWVVPAKRQPLFPTPNSVSNRTQRTQQSSATSPSAVSPPAVSPSAATGRIAKPRSANRTPMTAATPAPAAPNYFDSAKRPIVSLYFLLPLILCYEIAKIFVGVERISSGIDLWVHNFLCIFGAGQLVILPLLTTAVMLFYHHQIKDQWHVTPSTLGKMAAEAIGFGFMLFFFAHIFQIAAVASPTAGKLVDPYYWQIGSTQWWANVVTYVGTGIHEELIFRVILMLPAIAFLKDMLKDKQVATAIAVVGVGLLFALAHVDFVNPLGQPFDPVSFSLRFIASCIFSAVFLYRGFGIVVGTHIVYNVLTLLG